MNPTPVLIDGCAITPALMIPAPAPCTPRRFGLYSAVGDPLPLPDPHAASGVEWQPEHDCAPGLVRSWCPKCTTPGDAKEFDGLPGLASAHPFAVYGSAQCAPVGWTADQMQARARQRLEQGEQHRVEAELIGSLRTAATTDLTPPGGAVSPRRGLVELENFAAQASTCIGVLHVPAGLPLAFPAGSIVFGTGLLTTALRTPIAAGSGYFENVGPDGTPAPDGEFWVYLTGPVRLWRSEIFEVAPEIAASLNRSDNTISALAERTVVLGFDCPNPAAIRIAVS